MGRWHTSFLRTIGTAGCSKQLCAKKKMTTVLNESPCSNDIKPLSLFQSGSLNHDLNDVTLRLNVSLGQKKHIWKLYPFK